MAKIISFEVLKALHESRKPKKAVEDWVEVKARRHAGHSAREATENKPARAFSAAEPWHRFPRQDSVEEARRTAERFHANCEYIITVNGVVVEHHKKTRATPIGKKIATSGSVSGMKGIRFEYNTGYRGPLENAPVTAIEEYIKDGRVQTKEIRVPDLHQIVAVKGKRKRIRKPTPGHKWEQRGSVNNKS